MSAIKISHRAEKTPPSPIRKLAGLAQEAANRGTHVYRLNIGQPDLRSPNEFIAGIDRAIKPVVAYEASQGSPELLRAWCDYLNRGYSLGATPEQMLITVGASEALIFSFMVCCDPGDEILIFDPTYANYIGFASIAGVRLVPLPCPPESGTVVPSREDILRFISPYTRAILVCNPNNPTGSVCDDEQLRMLLDLCHQEDLFLIVDETYREFVFDGLRPRCVFELSPKDQNVIVVDSISKRFSLCGARIGCLLTWNRELMQAAFHIAQARLAAPTIEQDAAAHMLRTVGDNYLKEAHSEYNRRRDAAVAALKAIPGVKVFIPKGGFYLLAQLPVEDAEAFATYMLTDFEHNGATTFVAPAAGFYMHREMGRRTIRIAFVLNELDTQKAISVLAAGLLAYSAKGLSGNFKRETHNG
ncbi:MAG: pyridoxal phosphate-dependent aminotransferase [Pseudomonadota bacterium]|jgi:aspartate aminotransferase